MVRGYTNRDIPARDCPLPTVDPPPGVGCGQEYRLVRVSKKIPRLVGRLGSGVRVSARFQNFSRGNLWGNVFS